MSKSKRADLQKKYLTNNEKQPHVRVFKDLYFSPAFMALTHTAQIVYIGLLQFSGGDTRFSVAYSTLKKVCAKDTFNKAVEQLCEKGFLKRERVGYWNAINYELSEDWKNYSNPPKVRKMNEKSLENLRKAPPKEENP